MRHPSQTNYTVHWHWLGFSNNIAILLVNMNRTARDYIDVECVESMLCEAENACAQRINKNQ